MLSRVSYKTLLIVESPSKCKTIERLLGPGYMCVATCGHLRDLAIKPDLSDIPAILSSSSKEPPYTKSSKKMDYIRNIQNAISKCNGTVILATDADREGESIAWHVCQLFHLSVEFTPRIVFNEITQTALLSAMRNPRRIDMNLVNSQQARQVIDFIIGYGITPMLWTTNTDTSAKSKSKPVQSAGRCQTPALRIMYDAYAKMKDAALHPNIEYRCTAYFTRYDIPFSLSKRVKCDDIQPFLYFYTRTDAGCDVAQNHIFDRRGTNAVDTLSLVSYKPPAALKTSALQQFGSATLKITPSETMDIAQKLYETGYITYHRTESTRVSDEFRTAASAFVCSNWDRSYVPNTGAPGEPGTNMLDAAAAAGAAVTASGYAHEAIRPVNVLTLNLPETDSREFGKNEKMLYAFIWTRAVCSCMTNAVYEKLTANVSVLDTHTYTYNAYRPKFAGWRACASRYGGVGGGRSPVHHDTVEHEQDNDKDKQEPDFLSPQFSSAHFDYLQTIVSGSVLPYNTINCLPVVTNAFAPHTYGSLIRQLEKMGIGRPSTFASIVHTLKKRDYITTASDTIDTDTDTDTGTGTAKPEFKETYKITNRGAGPIGGTVTVINASIVSKHKNRVSNSIHITQHGQGIIESLFPKCESVLAYDYTREMEERLDRVASGRIEWHTVCRECADCIDGIKNEIPQKALVIPLPLTTQVSTAVSASGILRRINDNASVRQGQYGAYIFYRTPAMKKPKFIPLKGFPYSIMECDETLVTDWIDEHV